MPKMEFEMLVKPAIDSLSPQLAGHPFKDRILGRILNCYRMGATERIEMFLNEIELPVGRTEKKLIAARNRYAHGGCIDDPEDMAQANAFYQGYLSLFNRSFLRILNHQGTYTDLSSRQMVERQLDEPLGKLDGWGFRVKPKRRVAQIETAPAARCFDKLSMTVS